MLQAPLPVCSKAGPYIPRRARMSRGGPIYLKAGLSVLRRIYLTRGGSVCPEVVLMWFR